MELVLLYYLMVMDYILTKVGMTIGAIQEGNVLMLWLMEMPMLKGMIVKMCISLVLIVPLVIARDRARKAYVIGMFVVYAVYAVVYGMHVYWMYAVCRFM